MIKLDRICVWLFIINFAFMAMNGLYFSLLDEGLSYLMGIMALADCVFNRNWKRYRLLGIIILVLLLYWINTLLFRRYNTPVYVTADMLMMLKPFIPLCVFYGMGITLTPLEREATRWACWFNITLMCLCVGMGELAAQRYIISYIVYFGQTCLTTALVYLWVSLDEKGNITQSSLVFIVFTLILGLWCGRSKYYGQSVIFLFLIFAYRPGMFSRLSMRNSIIAILMFLTIIALAWKKIALYYFTPDYDLTEAQETMARMALLYGMVQAISGYPLLGAGLASFGTSPSVWHYSGFYVETGLDKVWGLSPSKSDFVSDNFIATLGGELGLLGLALIIWLFVWLYRKNCIFLHVDYPRYRFDFIISVTIILAIVIENSNGNIIFPPAGLTLLAVLGSLTALSDRLRNPQSSLTVIETNHQHE